LLLAGCGAPVPPTPALTAVSAPTPDTGATVAAAVQATVQAQAQATLQEQTQVAAAKTPTPSITLDEALNAAEYLATEGNRKVIFCLRGMKTNMGDPHRNFVDFSHVPAVKRLTRMPVRMLAGRRITGLLAPLPNGDSTRADWSSRSVRDNPSRRATPDRRRCGAARRHRGSRPPRPGCCTAAPSRPTSCWAAQRWAGSTSGATRRRSWRPRSAAG